MIKNILITALLIFLAMCGIAMVDVGHDNNANWLMSIGGIFNFGALIYLGMRIERETNNENS